MGIYDHEREYKNSNIVLIEKERKKLCRIIDKAWSVDDKVFDKVERSSRDERLA